MFLNSGTAAAAAGSEMEFKSKMTAGICNTCLVGYGMSSGSGFLTLSVRLRACPIRACPIQELTGVAPGTGTQLSSRRDRSWNLSLGLR